jgi:hypothetical protein
VEALEVLGGHARLTPFAGGRALGVSPGGRVTEWVKIDLPASHAAYLSALRFPCATRVMGLLPRADAALTPHLPGASLDDVVRASRLQGGAIEPELLACVVGRAGLGLDFTYSIARPPLRGVVAKNMRVCFDGQVRLEVLGQLSADPDFVPGSGAEPFAGGAAAPGESAPFPARREEADAFALMDALHRALVGDALGERPSADVPAPIARLCRAAWHRELSVLELSTELVLYAGRAEEDIGGLARGLLPEEHERQQERALELAMFPVEGDEEIAESTDLDLEETVRVGALEVDRFPVSCARYADFLDGTGHAPPAGWPGRAPPPGRGSHPVTGIGPADARAFAVWARARVPTELEWERLAGEARFPWGARFDETRTDRAFLEPWTSRRTRALEDTRGDNAAGVSGLCRQWEWTSTRGPSGWIVRGGPWRDRVSPGEIGNRSYEDGPSNDVGLRLVRDG